MTASSSACSNMFLWSLFFNATAATEIYTLSLHDALPISHARPGDPTARAFRGSPVPRSPYRPHGPGYDEHQVGARSEEHTSELQSHSDLVCRLLLEKKKKNY